MVLLRLTPSVHAGMPDFAVHPMAAIFGEADALSSMIASRPPTAASRRLVIDKGDPLAMLAAKR
jgi:hypothetical protein